jgi:hypothetical protein
MLKNIRLTVTELIVSVCVVLIVGMLFLPGVWHAISEKVMFRLF